MLTFDREESTQAVVDELSIDQYFTGALSDEEGPTVAQIQSERKSVAMVGMAPTMPRCGRELTWVSPLSWAWMWQSGRRYYLRREQLAGCRTPHYALKGELPADTGNLVLATGYNAFALPPAAGRSRQLGSCWHLRLAQCSRHCRRSSLQSTCDDSNRPISWDEARS